MSKKPNNKFDVRQFVNKQTFKQARKKKPKFIIDPKKMTAQDEIILWKWATEIMKKHEKYMNSKIPNKKVIARSGMDTNDLQIEQFQPFGQKLNWVIYRDHPNWSIIIRRDNVILAKLSFAKI